MALKTQQSNEELLKLLNESKELPSETKEDSVLKFINFYQLVPGADKVSSNFLFKLFKNYIKSPISSTLFNKDLSIHFTRMNGFYFVDIKASRLDQVLNRFEAPKESFQDGHIALVTNFIDDCEVSQGQDLIIDSTALYELMKLYAHRLNKRTKVTFDGFDQISSELLTPVVTKKGNVYKLSNGLLKHFTIKEIEDAKNGKKEDKTITRKIPKSKTRT